MEAESAEAVLSASDRAPRFHLDVSHCSLFLVIFQPLCAELHVRGEYILGRIKIAHLRIDAASLHPAS